MKLIRRNKRIQELKSEVESLNARLDRMGEHWLRTRRHATQLKEDFCNMRRRKVYFENRVKALEAERLHLRDVLARLARGIQ